MKFNCGETWKEKEEKLSNWHRYLAIFPIRVADHDCRFFEYIERKGEYQNSMYGGWWEWEYRAKP